MKDTGALTTLYIKHFNDAVREVRQIRGDGSGRLIYRVHGENGTAVGVVGENVEENRAFIGFTRSFNTLGLGVPDIYAVGEDERCYIEEDLGDMTLYDWLVDHRYGDAFPSGAEEIYRTALADLLLFQIEGAGAVDFSLCYTYDVFGYESMWFDVRYFVTEFLEPLYRRSFDNEALEREAKKLIVFLLEADRRYFLYRDFQSRNLMLKAGRVRYIDYQSGRRGALQYDVASLLYDAKALIPEDVRRSLLRYYIGLLADRRDIQIDPLRFEELFDGYAIMRIMQALGAFGKLGFRLNKPNFRSSIPPALKNLRLLAEKSSILQSLPYLRSLFIELSEDKTLMEIVE